MRFMTYKAEDGIGLAAKFGDEYRGRVTSGTLKGGSLIDLLRQGGHALDRAYAELEAAPVVELDKVEVLPPLPNPPKIICVGLNYSDHTQESGFKQPDHPTFFPRFASSLIGAGAPIVRPDISETLDYEGELVAIIGKGGRNIAKADAHSHIAGWSIFNDGSIREFQHRTPQWTLGKNFDDTGAFGPEFVTADELPPGAKGLRIETRLNGEVMQASNTDALVFDVATLVAAISEAMTLEPGDVIVTGTPSGIGHARDPKVYMKPGDVCEVEIEGIGILRSPIVSQSGSGRT